MAGVPRRLRPQLHPRRRGTELFEISSGPSSKYRGQLEPGGLANPTVTITGSTTASAVIDRRQLRSPDRFVHRAGGGDDTDATSYNKTIPYRGRGAVGGRLLRP